VAAQTAAKIETLGWSLRIGETLRDVDEPDDLLHLRRPGGSPDLGEIRRDFPA
jgi:glycosyltransferase A (GT-A) superfamily protein (DUF2064 family)